jgi:hypothetical protein
VKSSTENVELDILELFVLFQNIPQEIGVPQGTAQGEGGPGGGGGILRRWLYSMNARKEGKEGSHS